MVMLMSLLPRPLECDPVIIMLALRLAPVLRGSTRIWTGGEGGANGMFGLFVFW
jgi:hypothetical protein